MNLADKVLARFLGEFPKASPAAIERLRAIISEESKPVKRPKQSEMGDEEWIASLVGDSGLRGINVRAEIAACGRWYRENVSKTGAPTRRRIVNWLNKAERVVDLKAMGAQHATGLKVPPPAGPENWRDWLRVQLDCISPETDGFSQLKAAFLNSNFNLMPGSWQARCRAQVIRPPAA